MAAHSEEYLTDDRQYWWNEDYLELIANRLKLHECSRMLDVGCGKCHWTKAIGKYLKRSALITAVDMDSRWSLGETETVSFFKEKGMDISFEKMDACRLGFADGQFDVVTCQTLLLHLSDPETAVSEMYRVLRPGGILLCVEPDNIVNCLENDTVASRRPVEELKILYEFEVQYDRGRHASGLGRCVTESIPLYFQRVGLKRIRVYNNDKVDFSFPPYTREGQSEDLDAHEKEKSKRYLQAINAGDSVNETYWRLRDEYREAALRQMERNEYSQVKGYAMYLFVGEK